MGGGGEGGLKLLCIRQPPSNEQKTAWRLCCTLGGWVEGGSAEPCN